VDFGETEERQALRTAVAEIARSFGPAYYAAHAAERKPCDELWAALGEAGFIGINIPAEYGGGGAGRSELAIVCEESAAQGCPLLLLLVSSAICGEVISRYGSPEQRKDWLPPLASGQDKIVFAITEPDAGSNSRRLSTTATAAGGGDWLLAGTKYYISGVDDARAILVVARTGTDEATGHARLSLFLVRHRRARARPGSCCRSTCPAAGAAVHAALRRGLGSAPESARWASRGRRVRAGVPRAESRSGSPARRMCRRRRPARAGPRRPSYANAPARSGTVPVGAHQGVAHPLAQGEDRDRSWPG
jgi:alkylation response protein AidB-like acyl-CoA dehydrogenase